MPEREFHYAAVQLLEQSRRELVPADIKTMEWMLIRNSWWDTVDAIAGTTLGTMLLAHPGLYATLDSWSAVAQFLAAPFKRGVGQRKLKGEDRRGAPVPLLPAGERGTDGVRLHPQGHRLGKTCAGYADAAIVARRARMDSWKSKTAPLSPLSVREALKNVRR